MVGITKAILIAFLGSIALYIIRTLQVAYRKGIRSVPGPWQARFSIFYRLSMVMKGKAVQEYREVHEKYGSIVRVGPKHVSINDPMAVQQIYGISSKFRKVTSKPCTLVNLEVLTKSQVGVLLRISTILGRKAARQHVHRERSSASQSSPKCNGSGLLDDQSEELRGTCG